MDDAEASSSKINKFNPSGRPPGPLKYPRASEESWKPYELNPSGRPPGSLKYPRASIPYSNPEEPAAPLERKFEMLLNRHLESRTEAGMDNGKAIDDLMQSLDSVEETDKFFKETAKYFEETRPHDCDIAKLKKHISTANWMTRGEDLEFVYFGLRQDGFPDDHDELYDAKLYYIPLGILDDFALALQIDIGAMVPQEADSTTIESFEVFSVTSNRTLGARYDCMVPGHGKETMIFAQFG